MTDQQIIEALISRDEWVTLQFFFRKCRPLFMSIMRHVFSYEVDYDEFVNEFYLHLMENDAYRLRPPKETLFETPEHGETLCCMIDYSLHSSLYLKLLSRNKL